ncbi:MAG: protein-glutamate O-methyltransferase CheR [Planctomycetes bacterium]|nr:protein-glutamate O-methyltransferase CheR [Planctomycetota bacterium]
MTTLATSDFQRIASIARDRWGLCLTEKKMPLVSNRLSSFLRHSRFDSTQAYLDYLEEDAGEEDMLVFFDLLSTNVTSFFRDRNHFDYLEREFYTPLARGNITLPGKRIRIWSAACSTGQEPYTLAMHAIESLPDLANWDFKILGTDLSNFAVEQAKAGTYAADKMDGIPQEMLRTYFTRGTGANKDQYTVTRQLRSLVTIARLNLMDPWPFKGHFDVIFCRNVMIYFDADTRRKLVLRFHQLLRPGGILAIGSAETLAGLNVPFTAAQASVYLKH